MKENKGAYNPLHIVECETIDEFSCGCTIVVGAIVEQMLLAEVIVHSYPRLEVLEH